MSASKGGFVSASEMKDVTAGATNWRSIALQRESVVVDAGSPGVDAGAQPPEDAGTTQTPDAAAPPTTDAGTTEEPDAAVVVVTPDAGTMETPDAGTVVTPDAGATQQQQPDASVGNNTGGGSGEGDDDDADAEGGCHAANVGGLMQPRWFCCFSRVVGGMAPRVESRALEYAHAHRRQRVKKLRVTLLHAVAPLQHHVASQKYPNVAALMDRRWSPAHWTTTSPATVGAPSTVKVSTLHHHLGAHGTRQVQENALYAVTFLAPQDVHVAQRALAPAAHTPAPQRLGSGPARYPHQNPPHHSTCRAPAPRPTTTRTSIPPMP